LAGGIKQKIGSSSSDAVMGVVMPAAAAAALVHFSPKIGLHWITSRMTEWDLLHTLFFAP